MRVVFFFLLCSILLGYTRQLGLWFSSFKRPDLPNKASPPFFPFTGFVLLF